MQSSTSRHWLREEDENEEREQEEKGKLTSPQILSSISLVMDFLLDQMLVLWIIWVQDHDRLPAPLALVRITNLKRCRGDEHRERQSLGVHSCLHQLLSA